MHAISSYHGNRLINTQTHRQDRLQYTAPQLARSVITMFYVRCCLACSEAAFMYPSLLSCIQHARVCRCDITKIDIKEPSYCYKRHPLLYPRPLILQADDPAASHCWQSQKMSIVLLDDVVASLAGLSPRGTCPL